MNEVEEDITYLTAGYEPATPPRDRITPSGAVVWAYEQLKSHPRFRMQNALDIGCGRGRNSLYLAEKGMNVTAIDFAPNAIAALQEAAEKKGLNDKIRCAVQDATEDWPVASNEIDLAVDAFCFKHLTPRELQVAYKEYLLRALSTNGHYLFCFDSIGDGYYGRYVKKHDDSAKAPVEIDSFNGIESTLYAPEDIVHFYQPELSLYMELSHEKLPTMDGQAHKQKPYALLFQRASHARKVETLK